MEARVKDLSQIKAYIEDVDKEVTMILQNLQWDRKRLLESAPLAACRYNASHRVPQTLKGSHEARCLLNSYGYTQEHRLLPDPPDDKASTLVKLSKEDINQIIENAAKCDPLFKRVLVTLEMCILWSGIEDVQPLTLERLQSSFTADERRAIHDAVANVAPTVYQLSDLTLPGGDDVTPSRERSRVEVLAELRDMKRRRTKYRTAARTSKYSDVLRDVIKTQMDLYCEALDGNQSYKLPENCVNGNNNDTIKYQGDTNTTLTKNNSSYRKETSKSTNHAYMDNRYSRNSKDIFSERPNHKHQNSRREHYDNRYSNDSFEDRKRRDDIKHKRHHKQDRDEHRQSKPESYEYKLDREIKKEPEEYSTGHRSKSYEGRSCEQSKSKYRNDSKYKDRQRLHYKEYYFSSREYDNERSEPNSKPTNRCKDRRRRPENCKHHERKRKHHNDRAKKDFYIPYDDIKREKSDDSATEDNVKRKKY